MLTTLLFALAFTFLAAGLVLVISDAMSMTSPDDSTPLSGSTAQSAGRDRGKPDQRPGLSDRFWKWKPWVGVILLVAAVYIFFVLAIGLTQGASMPSHYPFAQ